MVMSKREAVVLVSRALAVIQIMSALLEITYLPQRLFVFSHRIIANRFSDLYGYWSLYDFEGTLALILRIAILLLAAYLFWHCSGKIERFLLPPPSESQTPDASATMQGTSGS
jgi:hypothetical protein